MHRTLNLNSFFENINGQVINAWAVSRSHKTCGMDEIGPIIINVKFLKGNKMFYKIFTLNVCLKALKQL